MGPMMDEGKTKGFDATAMAAMAHLYRGEMYRSKIWRTRLDATTNWAVATTGIAISVSFSGTSNSGLPILLTGMLVTLFLLIEGRRYRYFDIWRSRVRLLEIGFYAPMLRREPCDLSTGWAEKLAEDYERLHFHITWAEAVGRRLRRNYLWIFLVLGASFLAKLAIHPTHAASVTEFVGRASIGPIAGAVVLTVMVLAEISLVVLALWTLKEQRALGRVDFLPTDDPSRRSARDE